MTSLARQRNVRNDCLPECPHRLHTAGTTNYCTTYIACHFALSAVQEVRDRMHSLHVDSMAVPSLLGRSYITNMRGHYVRSDLVFRPRKHCGPASARAVPVLVNAMLTIHHDSHHSTLLSSLRKTHTSPATKQPACYPARPVIPWCCIGTSS